MREARGVVIALLFVLTGGCAKSNAVQCGNLVCPEGTACAPTDPPLCVQPDQLTICTMGKKTGEPCSGDNFAGICTADHLCLPGCGDGEVTGIEQCDDANHRNHDGCSSTCLVERPTWQPFVSPWQSRAHAAVTSGVGRVFVFGGETPLGIDDALWVWGGSSWIPGPKGPPARSEAVAAYDTSRGLLVVFGGNASNQVLGDTWEFSLSAHAWTHASPTVSPPARRAAGMAFDPVRNRVELYGGIDINGQVLDDTWEYNGTTWAPVTSTTQPPKRSHHAMAYDPARSAVVVFGGLDALQARQQETWELANGQWNKITTAASPPSRTDTGIAFDTVRNKLVLFGGSTGPTDPLATDTWTYDGNWTQITTIASPAGRWQHGVAALDTGIMIVGGSSETLRDDVWMFDAGTPGWQQIDPEFEPTARTTTLAYDEKNYQVVLFGGQPSVSSPYTWTFDVTWHAMGALPPPQVTQGNTLAYDPMSQRTVMFGGRATSTSADLAGTYAFDGNSTWTAVTTGGPPARSNASMAFDREGAGVLFGGNAGATLLGDTWELRGSTWTMGPTSGPPAQSMPPLAYDQVGQRTILFDASGTTWSYAHQTWTRLAPSTPAPPARHGAALVYDTFRKKIQLVGGTDEVTFFGDFWELDGDVWHSVDVTGVLPPPREQFSAIYAPFMSSILMFGADRPAALDDTWLLRFRSPTPDEICGDGIDNDGDHFVDADDPDCLLP